MITIKPATDARKTCFACGNPAEIEIPSRNGIISVSFCAMCRTAIAPILPARPAAEIEIDRSPIISAAETYGRALAARRDSRDFDRFYAALLEHEEEVRALATPAPVPADLAALTERAEAAEAEIVDCHRLLASVGAKGEEGDDGRSVEDGIRRLVEMRNEATAAQNDAAEALHFARAALDAVRVKLTEMATTARADAANVRAAEHFGAREGAEHLRAVAHQIERIAANLPPIATGGA